MRKLLIVLALIIVGALGWWGVASATSDPAQLVINIGVSACVDASNDKDCTTIGVPDVAVMVMFADQRTITGTTDRAGRVTVRVLSTGEARVTLRSRLLSRVLEDKILLPEGAGHTSMDIIDPLPVRFVRPNNG